MEGGYGRGGGGVSPRVFLAPLLAFYLYTIPLTHLPPSRHPPAHFLPTSFKIWGLLSSPPSVSTSLAVVIPLSCSFPIFSPFPLLPSTTLSLVYCPSLHVSFPSIPLHVFPSLFISTFISLLRGTPPHPVAPLHKRPHLGEPVQGQAFLLAPGTGRVCGLTGPGLGSSCQDSWGVWLMQ